MRDAADLHVPVLLDAVIDLLSPALGRGGIMFDATLGMGGHTEAALNVFSDITVIGIDRDPDAIELASKRLAPFGERFRAFHGPFDRIVEVADRYGRPDAILMDLGVSSLQLDEAERGFAYSQDGPLDMRMGQEGESAADLLARVSHAELTRILKVYGEEKFASRIAAKILDQDRPGDMSTAELAELVRDSIPAPARRTGGHPAKRTFQALRIAVNDELGMLERTLPVALDLLRPGGRLVVESYHSLEDRIVKSAMVAASSSPTPIDLPVQPEEPPFRMVTGKATKAHASEVAHNSRSASVRLRACEKREGLTA